MRLIVAISNQFKSLSKIRQEMLFRESVRFFYKFADKSVKPASEVLKVAPYGHDAKLNNKLKAWWEFENFAAFRAEVKKAFKADIPLAERSDWEDWMMREKSEIARLTSEIQSLEGQINALVYELFELTDEEISLLESQN